MSTRLIETEIRRFLSTAEPEATCIGGHWGVGKTYAWNKFLKEAKEHGGVVLKRYSYVSLFGINSLDEFKYAIFENTVQTSEIGVVPSLKTFQTNTMAAAEGLGRKFVWFAQQLPWVRNHVGGLGPVWFLSVKNTLICIDDIERRGKGLSVRDVMGLVSALKEQKGCKVLLILNDEALEDEKKEFDTYYEKVVDISIKFAPTAEDCTRIALAADTPAATLLAANTIALGISNIRLIKKIERAVRKIEPLLNKYDPQILKQAVQSLALFGWSLYEPRTAPSLEYLKQRHALQYLDIGKNKTVSVPEKEAAWNALLDVHGFSSTDEFDLVLLDGIRNGYFDTDLLKKHASDLHTNIAAAKQNNAFEAAWSPYHDSFDDNQDEVLDSLHKSFMSNVRNISPTNLNGTVTLMKELGRPEQAAEVIAYYIQNHSDNRDLFDLGKNPFSGTITDPDVITAFKTKLSTFPNDARDPLDILLSMAKTHSWTNKDLLTLSTLAIEEYYRIFKSGGNDLHRIINACLQFDAILNASETMMEVARRAREALRRIGAESPINARRVMKYGVNVAEVPTSGTQTGPIAADAPHDIE